jgi:signal peptidase I
MARYARDNQMAAEQPVETTKLSDVEQATFNKKEAARQRRLKFMLALLVPLVLLAYTYTTNYIPSGSMLPGLKPGDHILTKRAWLAYFGGRMPARGDVIVFNLPAMKQEDKDARQSKIDAADPEGRKPVGIFKLPPGEVLIKRVIGLPGETVQIKDGVVSINDKPLKEDYPIFPSSAETDDMARYAVNQPLKLGPDELFVMGDNRDNSEDGRFWGPLKRSNVIGKFIRVLFYQKNGPNQRHMRNEQTQP